MMLKIDVNSYCKKKKQFLITQDHSIANFAHYNKIRTY